MIDPRDEIGLDDRLDELSRYIVDSVVITPPEMKAKLRPPLLTVVKGVPNGLNNYCVPNLDGTKIILIGGLLYSFFLHYTRAAATYFLPSTPDGPRPSPLWPQARSALATTLDWISSPAPTPIFPPFEVTSRQARVAVDFADFAFRFALCHEMAHVVLEHVDVNPSSLGRVKDADVSVLRVSQQQELEADRFGLGLQVGSLRHRAELVTALAGSVYFAHITGLLDGRLMLLAHLVDYKSWKISLSHPPTLHRVFNLMGAAQAHGDQRGAGLQSVSKSLELFGAEIYDTARKQQDSVAKETVGILENELANISTTKPLPATPAPALAKELRRLFNLSPIGVIRAFEPEAIDVSVAPVGTGKKLQALTEQFASTLPAKFQEFRVLTRAQRAEIMA